MATLRLTDRTVQTLEAGRYQKDYWDSQLPGFGVRVSPSGKRSFVVMYYAAGGKRRMTLGPYPALSLADARQRAKAALYEVASGTDPLAERIARREAETFGELAEEYLRLHARPKKRSWKEDQRMLERDLLPAWKNLKAQEIRKRDVIRLLDRIMKRGSPVMANRTRALISQVYNFGIGRDIVDFNPAQGVPRPAKEQPRDRVLTEAEIRRLWEALDCLSPAMAGTFRTRLLTAQRGVEVLTMRWESLDGDWWQIPAEVSKNGQGHRVPLAPQALDLLDSLRPSTGHSPWVFASPRKEGARITAVQKAAQRVATAAQLDFVPHDLRRTAASFMTSMGTSRLVVSKILNHTETGVTAIYDRYSYEAEKRQALVRWADRLDTILSGVERDNVVRIA